jgi:hypothetical protein
MENFERKDLIYEITGNLTGRDDAQALNCREQNY